MIRKLKEVFCLMNIRKAVKSAIDKNDYNLLLDAYKEDSGQVLRNLQLHVFGLVTEPTRWQAIVFLGLLARDFAKNDDLTYRNVIRRFIWQMCEEGANVPWASPEVVCSILSNTGTQFDEFIGPVFFHASLNEINYAGMFWGMVQLGKERQEKFKEKLDEKFFARLIYKDVYVRAYGAWAMTKMPMQEAKSYLENLLEDSSEVLLYEDCKMKTYKVCDLAKIALDRIMLL